MVGWGGVFCGVAREEPNSLYRTDPFILYNLLGRVALTLRATTPCLVPLAPIGHVRRVSGGFFDEFIAFHCWLSS